MMAKTFRNGLGLIGKFSDKLRSSTASTAISFGTAQLCLLIASQLTQLHKILTMSFSRMMAFGKLTAAQRERALHVAAIVVCRTAEEVKPP